MAQKSKNREDYQNVPRPIGAMAKEFPRGFVSSKHQHKRAQFLYAVTGVLEVSTVQGLWIIPPQRAIWIPPNTDHEVRFLTNASVRTLYIRADAIPLQAPQTPCVVKVTPLLRELIIRIIALPVEYDEQGRDNRLVSLALEEIVWTPVLPLYLPTPKDKRLIRIAEVLSRNPDDANTLAEWALIVGASSRTLARLFQNEFGVSFMHWRQQLRILASLPKLANGESVTNIALDLGYETPGAFAAMFRKHMGIVPSQYFTDV